MCRRCLSEMTHVKYEFHSLDDEEINERGVNDIHF